MLLLPGLAGRPTCDAAGGVLRMALLSFVLNVVYKTYRCLAAIYGYAADDVFAVVP